MHLTIVCFLVLFAGWTLAVNFTVLTHGSLRTLSIAAPVMLCIVMELVKRLYRKSRTDTQQTFPAPHSQALPVQWPLCAAGFATLAALLFSWALFWVMALCLFACLAFSARNATCVEVLPVEPPRAKFWIAAAILLAAGLTYTLNRSDADDALYVSIAAFHAGHPDAPLLRQDTIHGEAAWPLLHPGYQLTSYEILAAFFARLFGHPAMNLLYDAFPPLWAALGLMACFLCTRELAPRHWFAAGVLTLALGLLLGEEHRGFANFALVRLFQGKAVYVWLILPAIYWLALRYAGPRGGLPDLVLLACAQIAAIGFSSFAIIGIPLAILTAALSAQPFHRQWRKTAALLITGCVMLPYAAALLLVPHPQAAIAKIPVPSPEEAWRSVLGARQQFLVAALLLFGPLLSRDPLLRWRLAVPPLLLFALPLNPLFASFIAAHLTTPPVFWRVLWSWPLPIYCAVSACVIASEAMKRRDLANPAFCALGLMGLFLLVALPFNALREGNGVRWQMGGPKIAPAEYDAVQQMIRLADAGGRVLAPEPVASVIARFERHPPLVFARSLYFESLEPVMPQQQYQARRLLADAVQSPCSIAEPAALSSALTELDVRTVLFQDCPGQGLTQTLQELHFSPQDKSGPYALWRKALP